MVATMLALLNPGDEVVVFEPFYENYGPTRSSAARSPATSNSTPPIGGSTPMNFARGVQREDPGHHPELAEQPDRKVFSLEELTYISKLCQEFDALAITDEIYEHIVYDGARAYPDVDAAGHARAHGHPSTA